MQTTSAIVKITERARGIAALDDELQSLLRRMAAERDQHAAAIAAERARHEGVMAAMNAQQRALEQAIFQLGAN